MQVPGESEVRFERARPEDAELLTEISRQTFADDNALHGIAGGPRGNDSVEWQRQMIRKTDYWKILVGDSVVGGMVVYPVDGGRYEIGRIFVATDWQDRGIGRAAMDFAHGHYPEARGWQLDTPAWATRNQHFYEKLGYRKVGLEPAGDFDLVLYRRP